jgi:calcium-translocating P-type ATPase
MGLLHANGYGEASVPENDRMNEAATALPGDEAAWHALPGNEALRRLGSSEAGLAGAEAKARLQRYGPNRLPAPERRGPLRRFLAQFRNVLIYVLLGAAAVAAALGEGEDALVILGVVVINAIVGFVQEGKAETALEAIGGMLSPKATVVREGARTTVPAEDLVPGDIVFLQSGDRVPADLRLLSTTGLRCDEAALTGESIPVDKDEAPVPAGADLGDRRSMAYSGTLVTSGQATGVAVATGASTEIGRIGRLLASVETLETPLMRKLDGFARRLTVVILLLAVVVLAFGTLVWGYGTTEMFMAAIGIAVAAIPEGLPAIMTIALAVGVRRMARRHAIVRHLPSVETLGSVTVICTDKTGTLTRNEMTVRTVVTEEGSFAVAGSGYTPEGGVEHGGRARGILTELARAVALCNEARLEQADGTWRLTGDPTEGALLTLALKLGLDPAAEAAAHPRCATIPFESERQYMATSNRADGGGWLLVKGAVERLLPMCRAARGPEGDLPLDLAAWHARMEALADSGQRVLAVAMRDLPAPGDGLDEAEATRDLVLLGLVGLIDPPRPEAVQAVARCRAAGIRVKMITGDHAVTARAIAREIGLTEQEAVVTGRELATLDDGTLEARAAEADIFARVTPEQKLRLVEALQRRGEIVAMTGDGVNDAPALKRADIGVAMGERGTEAAKEAARMVLADDNFASIEAAVEEGRTVYDNLKKSIVFILPTSAGGALVIVGAILVGAVLPITPIQILWINMVTTVTLALALSVEPTEPGTMARPPRAPDEPLISGRLLGLVGLVSLLILAGVFGGFQWYRSEGASLELARTVAVNTIVALQAFYLFNCRRLASSALSREGILGNRWALMAVAAVGVLQLLFTYAPPLQALFATRPLALADWLFVLPVAASVLLVVDGSERLLQRLGPTAPL